jgi:hypothetical protein
MSWMQQAALFTPEVATPKNGLRDPAFVKSATSRFIAGCRGSRGGANATKRARAEWG